MSVANEAGSVRFCRDLQGLASEAVRAPFATVEFSIGDQGLDRAQGDNAPAAFDHVCVFKHADDAVLGGTSDCAKALPRCESFALGKTLAGFSLEQVRLGRGVFNAEPVLRRIRCKGGQACRDQDE